MHGSGGDWSTPKRSSKSKKKLRHCWVSRWRRQTATTSHDGCSCCPGADTRSDRQGLRGSERVARQRLPSAHPAGPAVGHALFQTCLLYTSDAADDLLCVDLGGRRII